MNGPSACTPSTLAPVPAAAIFPAVPRSAAASAPGGAVMNVGRNAVTPVCGSRAAA